MRKEFVFDRKASKDIGVLLYAKPTFKNTKEFYQLCD